MKRTCLQININTDEQNSCEFHPVEILINELHFDPKDNQIVKSFVQMKRIALFFLFSIALVMVASAQKELDSRNYSNMESQQDTSANDEHDIVTDSIMPRIRTWVLANEYAHKKEYFFDTLTTFFHHFNPIYRKSISNTYLGNYGTAYLSNDFFARENRSGFYFLKSFEAYTYQQSDVIFYNTTTPFSSLEYSQTLGSKENIEQRFSAFYTQNINPYSNIGFKFSSDKSIGKYQYQGTKDRYMNLFGSINRDHYIAYGSFIRGTYTSKENGGIKDTSVLKTTLPIENIIVNFYDGTQNAFSNRSFFTSHEYRIGKTVAEDDTISGQTKSVFIPRASAQYTFELTNYSRSFTETSINSNFFPNHYVDSLATYDSTSYRVITNTIQLKLLEAPDRKFTFGKRAFLQNEAIKASHSVVNGYKTYTFSDLNVGAEIFRSEGTFWNWNAYSKFTLLGKDIGDFILRGNLDKPFVFKNDTTILHVEGSYQDKSPNIFEENYFSNHTQWKNKFGKTHTLTIKGNINYPKYHFSAGLNYQLLGNYIYMNSNKAPDQRAAEFSILGVWANKDFTFGKHLGMSNKVLWQQVSNDEALHLPTISAYSSFYFTHHLFKVLEFQLGAEVYYNSKYYADAYDASTGQFYLQNTSSPSRVELGNYPYLNAFANMKLKRTRIFFSATHINSSFGNKEYFTTPGYPMNPFVLRYGLYWTFYD